LHFRICALNVAFCELAQPFQLTNPLAGLDWSNQTWAQNAARIREPWNATMEPGTRNPWNRRRSQPSPAMQARLDMLRRWSSRLDSAFEIPGLNIRFGWDPILGLLPGIGDLVTPLYSIAIVVTGMQLGIPKVVQLRMLVNVIIDALAGIVPVIGDAFDVAWKANEWNMRLLERHAWEERPASASDWLFVGLITVVMLAAVAVPVLAVVAILRWLGRGLV
jgi:hypothetical protein